MPIDEKSTLNDIEKSISDLEGSLTSKIDGKKISPISKIPFKVVALTFSLHHRVEDLAKNSLELYVN
ncbi:MAG: hypothetical protein GVY20_00340 [Bacteroidetes bacterium]|jgi:hypothetical protein|nr:hypothetical protein [Bacteroidota bacterium]